MSANQARAAVVVNEFVSQPSSGSEWVELFNNGANAVSVDNWRIVETYGGAPPVILTGTIPKYGMLTFELPASTLPDIGGVLILQDEGSNTQFGISYGDQNPGGMAHENAPGLGQSVQAQESGGATDGDWTTGSPTRGWCTPGVNGCPAVTTITTAMEAEGVSTNLDSMPDLSRITGLYFEKINLGRITFNATLNFTDQDAMVWLQDLGNKLSMSQNQIGLDADLIKNLMDTQATLIMYNVTLGNPTILVDGQADNQGIVSGLSYDQEAHTLTFTAAHFTVFTAVEGGVNSNRGSDSSGGMVCGEQAPGGQVDLFQIDSKSQEVTLYFTPARDRLTGYVVTYGYNSGDMRFGASFPATLSTGVEKLTIRDLAPGVGYWFAVRGGNGCMPGEWSNWLKVKTDGNVSYRYI